MRVYVSGPMSGMPEFNFPAFNATATMLRAQGYDVVNPVDINPDSNTSWETCLRRDLAAMLDCDAICMLPGWEKSRGATLERHLADKLGFKIVPDPLSHALDNLNPPAEALTFAPLLPESSTSKPTNPKDAIGIRKAPLSVVPLPVLVELGVAMLEGASKYGRHNYRGAGIRFSVYFDATIRHLFSWWEGEDIDQDSGLSHVTKAIASLTVLRDAMIRNKCTDDRPPTTAGLYSVMNAKAGDMLDRHAGKNPHHWTIHDNTLEVS